MQRNLNMTTILFFGLTAIVGLLFAVGVFAVFSLAVAEAIEGRIGQ